MLFGRSPRSLVSIAVAAALVLSPTSAGFAAVPASSSNTVVPGVQARFGDRSSGGSATITVTGTVRKALTHPATGTTPQGTSGNSNILTPTAEAKTWVQIQTADGISISVDPGSPALKAADPGDQVSAQVTVSPLTHTHTVRALTVVKKASVAKKTAHNAYVLVIDDERWPRSFSAADAKRLTQDAATYWKRESRNRITSFTVNAPQSVAWSDSCNAVNEDPLKFWRDARAQHYPGVDFEQASNHLVVFLPTGCEGALGYAGVASIGQGLSSGGFVTIMADSPHVAVHEFGHNFGLGHSNLEATVGGRTEIFEYFGAYGPQAIAIPHLTGSGTYAPGALDIGFQHVLGIANSPAVRTVNVRNKTTTTLTSVSATPNSGVQGITFTHPKTNQRHYIEYRAGTGRDTDTFYADPSRPDLLWALKANYAPGVRIYRVEAWENALYTTNLTSFSKGVYQTSFKSGEVFVSPDKSFTVRVRSTNAGKAVVSVESSATSTTLTVKKSTYGKRASATVKVTGASTATGKVAIYRGSKKVATGTLKKGVAAVKLPSTLNAGKVKLTAKYLGNSTLKPSKSSSKVLRVAKAKAKVKVVKTKNLKRGKKATVTLRMTGVSKTSPTGKVTLKVGKKTVSKATKVKKVKGKWQATVKTSRLPKGKVTVVYSGNKNLKRATYSAKRTLR